jgi:hypothetical protein
VGVPFQPLLFPATSPVHNTEKSELQAYNTGQKAELKGTVSLDFRLKVFYESVSPKHLSIPLRPFQIFTIILFGHLWVVELTYL